MLIIVITLSENHFPHNFLGPCSSTTYSYDQIRMWPSHYISGKISQKGSHKGFCPVQRIQELQRGIAG